MNLIEWLLMDLVWDGIAYNLGFVFCRAVTLGRLPETPVPDRQRRWMQVIGTLVFIAVVILVISIL